MNKIFIKATVRTLMSLSVFAAATSCKPATQSSRTTVADSFGVVPTAVQSISVVGRRDLLETSSATMTPAQPGIIFTVNDSGNDPILFALDSTGAVRGSWKIAGAINIDWESTSLGACHGTAAASNDGTACIFIGDAGDNHAHRPFLTIYEVAEPKISGDSAEKTLPSRRLMFRYPDGPHDVEAMYVSNDGTTYLITKRPLKSATGALRQSLVFTIASAAWTRADTVVATLTDSLPIVPGSAEERFITDASLSFDGRYLAVRTYRQIFVFATDSVTGRVINAVAPAICNIEGVENVPGEGITWFGGSRQLLLNSEKLNEPMHRLTCPLPQQ